MSIKDIQSTVFHSRLNGRQNQIFSLTELSMRVRNRKKTEFESGFFYWQKLTAVGNTVPGICTHAVQTHAAAGTLPS